MKTRALRLHASPPPPHSAPPPPSPPSLASSTTVPPTGVLPAQELIDRNCKSDFRQQANGPMRIQDLSRRTLSFRTAPEVHGHLRVQVGVLPLPSRNIFTVTFKRQFARIQVNRCAHCAHCRLRRTDSSGLGQLVRARPGECDRLLLWADRRKSLE